MWPSTRIASFTFATVRLRMETAGMIPIELINTRSFAVKRYPMRSIKRTFRTALHALRRNIMRSALTTLGIIIGVSAVITMVEIGSGSRSAIEQSIATMGADNVVVQPG